MQFIFLARPSLLVVPVMLLMRVIESAGPRASDCSDASAFAASCESADGSSTGRADAHPLRSVDATLMLNILAMRTVTGYSEAVRHCPEQQPYRQHGRQQAFSHALTPPFL